MSTIPTPGQFFHNMHMKYVVRETGWRPKPKPQPRMLTYPERHNANRRAKRARERKPYKLSGERWRKARLLARTKALMPTCFV